MSNVATRLLVDLKRERRMRAEVAAFDKELKAAVASKDKDKEEKLKKKKPQMDQMRLKASSGRFKVVIVTWLPDEPLQARFSPRNEMVRNLLCCPHATELGLC